MTFVQSVVIKKQKQKSSSELIFGGVLYLCWFGSDDRIGLDLGITDEAGWVVCNEKWKRVKLRDDAIGDIHKINFVKP